MEPRFRNPLMSVWVMKNCRIERARACHKWVQMFAESALVRSSQLTVVASGSSGTNLDWNLGGSSWFRQYH